MGEADRDVAEASQVAEGQLAEAVDLVAPEAVVDRSRLLGWAGLEATVEDSGGGLAVEGAVGSAMVVVLAKGVQLPLEVGQGGRCRLLGEEAF